MSATDAACSMLTVLFAAAALWFPWFGTPDSGGPCRSPAGRPNSPRGRHRDTTVVMLLLHHQ
jgi:hypothetical protein